MQLQPWQPGQQLLTNFDVKLGKLAASAKKISHNDSDVTRACAAADLIIILMMRQDHEKQHHYT
ncbi:hypothetical protein B5C26_03005 [Photorhabdus luminescens]|uniref:hypothetical protein n=1 Tax=Photorhabdus TaxID=29487 RepID=UPI000B4C438F|nr:MULTISPECIES: hypothetical protein [Photorhabdus]MCW7549237.1 hypothetical protein [Photorhabdus aballayi]OWO84021.1 hypothetical protein B5C26_03005 [Photorhabdus luminescens]